MPKLAGASSSGDPLADLLGRAAQKSSLTPKKAASKKEVAAALPDGITVPAPDSITSMQSVGEGVYVLPRYVPSRRKQVDILFVSPTTLNEDLEARTNRPRHLMGFSGALFERFLPRTGIGDRSWAYTTLIKYVTRKVKAVDVEWNRKAFADDIRSLQPKIIVCLGKKPFDVLSGTKFNQREVQGGFFWSEEFQCNLYCADPITLIAKRADRLERLHIDLREVNKWVQEQQGVTRNQIPLDYGVIENRDQLKAFVRMLQEEGHRILSVDCEWGRDPEHPDRPVTFTDGKLRSLQVCWKPGHARFIKFRDEKEAYTFDVPYRMAGDIMGQWFDRPEVKYIGHNVAADLVWMHHVLGLEWYQKVVWDTMFAEQTINESADQKLERLALKYTTLGRYDVDLIIWKKKHKEIGGMIGEDVGYALVPDKIIVDYGLRDVDTPMRAYPQQLKTLIAEGTLNYFQKYRLPFVTDGFVHMALAGIPTQRPYMDELRDTLQAAYDHLTVEFKGDLQTSACASLRQFLITRGKPANAPASYAMAQQITSGALSPSDAVELAGQWFRDNLNTEDQLDTYHTLLKHIEHVFACRVNPEAIAQSGFNIRSQPMMRRWLYEVKRFTPIKTTKVDGVQMAWEKVVDLPPDRRELFQPAVDKSSLTVFARDDQQVSRLLELNAIGNLLKAFLRQKTSDGKEQGLHKWICSDGCMHTNFVLTESNRPRSFNPNILNIPKYMAKPIEKAVGRLREMGLIESELYSIRSCMGYTEGSPWCLVDTDLQTAELVALAYLSGDVKMLKSCIDDDRQFALRIDPSGGDPIPVRIQWIQENTDIPVERQDPQLLYAADARDLVRDAQGNLVHPRRDQHWELAEKVMKTPRELLEKKKHRDGLAKPANFSCLAAGTLILTDQGYIPIEDVEDCMLVWDGVEWVSHDGVIYKGEQEVLNYEGISATADHKVWLEDGRKVEFRAAIECAGQLARTATACGKPKVAAFEDLPRDCPKGREWLLQSAHGVSLLRKAVGAGFEEPGEGVFDQVPLPNEGPNYGGGEDSFHTLPSHGPEVLPVYARVGCKLPTARDSGENDKKGVHCVGAEDVSGSGLQAVGFRSKGQQRALQPGQPSFGIPVGESSQSKGFEGHKPVSCGGVLSTPSGCGLRGKNGYEPAQTGALLRGDRRAEQKVPHPEHRSEARQQPRKVAVYDILNAGPRSRFTANGVLVSNCSYGATAGLLERRYKEETGLDPEEGMGQRVIDAWAEKNAIAWRYLEAQEQLVINPGYVMGVAGLRRHFYLHEDLSGLSDRQFRGMISGMTREARNFPMQNAVAETTARAHLWLIGAFRHLGLQAKNILLLYDALTTACPVEERFVIRALHGRMLSELNTWRVRDNRLLQFGVETDFCYRLGHAPSKQFKEFLYTQRPNDLDPTESLRRLSQVPQFATAAA